MLLTKYFAIWVQNVYNRKSLQQEERDEIDFARECMEPIHWCWNCKYSDCDIH